MCNGESFVLNNNKVTGLGSHTRETKGKKSPWYTEKGESGFKRLSFLVISGAVLLLLLMFCCCFDGMKCESQ